MSEDITLINNSINIFSNEYLEKCISINASFRNKSTINITENKNYYLENDPLILKKDSNEMKINIKNHNFEINDQIILLNAKSNNKKLIDFLILLENSSFLIIKYKHQLNENYKKYNPNFLINIRVETEKDYYENIPVNLLSQNHDVFIYNDIRDELLRDFVENLKVTDNLNPITDLLFVKLDRPFIISKNDLNIQKSNIYNYYVIEDASNFSYLNIGNIDLNLINANFPNNNERLNGFHIITRVERNYLYINLNQKSYIDVNSGSNNILIKKITNQIIGYPNPNNYVIQLTKPLNQVVQIELISTEIPNAIKPIDNININNNKFYWRILSDNNQIYQINIPPGNYNSDNLKNIMTDLMTQQTRIKQEFTIYQIDINNLNGIVSFMIYQRVSLNDPFVYSLENNIHYLIVSTNNLLGIENGDEIIISNSTDVLGIPSYIINQKFIVKNVTNKSFKIELPFYFNYFINLQTDKLGGANVFIDFPIKFQILNNFKDSVSSLLGFKDVGLSSSITSFKKKIYNYDSYNRFTEIPTSIVLNLNSPYKYIYLTLNNYSNIQNNDKVENAFAKINLSNKDFYNYNSFVSIPYSIKDPIVIIDSFNISFVDENNNLVNFNNIDNSFTLKIIEKVGNVKNTKIKSSSSN